jgi:hypothetical protein
MTDYSQQIADLQAAAHICEQHQMQPELKYPRWPNAWAACEKVWRNWLDLQTMKESDLEDRNFVNWEAKNLKGF